MRGGGREYQELRELLHVAKHLYKEGKETVKEFMDDDRDEGNR
jgi:hypothetical protein